MMAGEAVDSKATDRRWRTFDVFLESESAAQAGMAQRLLKDEAHRIAGAYGRAGRNTALQQVRELPWHNYIMQLWSTAVKIAGELTEEVLASKRSDIFYRAARQWLDRNGRARAAGLARTSRQNALKAIAAATEASASLDTVQDAVRQELEKIAVWRSETIARTEVHSAAYYGAFMAALASHQPLHKIWTAPRHPTRTCDQHLELHGVRAEMRHYFVIGEDRLMYPGDTELGAAPEQTINCRCSMDLIQLQHEQIEV
jgi:hypothetical protein